MRGKGRYAVFDPAVHAAMLRRLELEADLKRAVEQQEFVLYYQPIVDLQDGRARRVWRRWCAGLHPERGLHAAGRVHPAGRRDGLDRAHGALGLARGVPPGAASGSEQYPVTPPRRIAVNLSGLHLQQPAVVEDVVAGAAQSRGWTPIA